MYESERLGKVGCQEGAAGEVKALGEQLERLAGVVDGLADFAEVLAKTTLPKVLGMSYMLDELAKRTLDGKTWRELVEGSQKLMEQERENAESMVGKFSL